MTVLSLLFLIYKNQFFTLLAYSFSLSGALFNIACIVTGMIWGKETWGVYWAWDARLTSVAILLLFYIFYIAVFNSDGQSNSSMRIASITNLIGAINLPIIKFSVELWNSVHQPASIIRASGVSISPSMFYPLLIFFAAFAFFTASLTILNLHNTLLRKKINHLVIKKII
jgi:heme exporter protein C